MREYHKIQTVWHRDPSAKHKTLLEGVWSEPEFAYLAHNDWVWSEKVDGTNIRVIIKDGAVSFGGKTDNASIPAFLVERLLVRFPPDKWAAINEMFPSGACLYGEGYGARIQKGGGNYRADQDFVLFDVLVGEWWLDRETLVEIGMNLSLVVAPLIGVGTLPAAIKKTREGFSSQWGDFLAEGIVARPVVELRNRKGGRVITKIKHKDFLQ